MTSSFSEDDENYDTMSDFRRAVANFEPRQLAPHGESRKLLASGSGADGSFKLKATRLSPSGLQRRTESITNIPRSTSLMFRPVKLGEDPMETSATILAEEPMMHEDGSPPPPPPSMEDAFKPLPLHPVIPHSTHFYLTEEAVPPRLGDVPLPELYPLLGGLLALPDFQLNGVSFWLLDLLLEALLKAQHGNLLSAHGQSTLVAWFGFLLQSLREHAWTREQLFAHLETTMVEAAGEAFHSDWRVLSPDQLAACRPPSSARTSSATQGSQLCVASVLGTAAQSARQLAKSAPRLGVQASLPSQAEPSLSDEQPAFDPLAANAELAVIADLLYAVFANGFAHDVIKMAFCSPEEAVKCPLARKISFPKTLRPLPPPPKKEKKETAMKEKGAKKGKKDKKGGKGDKSDKKSDKSDKKSGKSSKKSEKSDKKSDKSSKKGKGGDGDGGKGKKGGKGGKKGKKGGVVEVEVVEVPVVEVPENPLARYRVEEVDWNTLEDIARLNKTTVCRLQDACAEKFFTDHFPPKEKKEKPEKKEKKGKDKKGKDKGGKDKKGKDKGGKDKKDKDKAGKKKK